LHFSDQDNFSIIFDQWKKKKNSPHPSPGGSCSTNDECTSNCQGNIGHCDHNGHCHCSHDAGK
jgi:hypothetical protein